jgi:tripartite-type tricarboxylate transporter receptor subunit TctC
MIQRASSLMLMAAATTLLAPGIAGAQAYPSRPLRLLVPSAPGGSPDINARELANELSQQMGQQVVVENRPGASGIIGYEMLARATPDGYTFAYISNFIATNPSMYRKLPYDFFRDFQPVILYFYGLNVLTVSQASPVRSVKELIDLAKANPGKLTFGSSGIGATPHLSMELFKNMTGTTIVHVPYKGTQQAVTDVIGGQIDILCDNLASLLPLVKSGRLRGLAVTALAHARRSRPAGLRIYRLVRHRGAGGRVARHRAAAECRNQQGTGFTSGNQGYPVAWWHAYGWHTRTLRAARAQGNRSSGEAHQVGGHQTAIGGHGAARISHKYLF